MPQFIFVLSAVILSIAITNTQCENILMLATCPTMSHHIWMTVLAKALSVQHNVTFVTVFPGENLGVNVTTIYLERGYTEIFSQFDLKSSADNAEYMASTPLMGLIALPFVYSYGCKGGLLSPGLQTIINYPSEFKFDLVINDVTQGPCYLFLIDKFNNPPMIAVSAFGNPSFVVDIVGGHNPYAYATHYAVLYTQEMNFWQRLFNTMVSLVDNWIRKWILVRVQDRTARMYVNEDFSYLGDIEQRTRLALITIDPAIETAIPLPPNVIQVAGLHIETPKILPTDIEEFIQKSEKGFVLFSLGTAFETELLTDERLKTFIDGMAQMPDYNFLWKFKSDQLLPKKLPENVLIKSFLPQNDLLAHPKCKAFLSHTGLLSTQEASWYGVPVVGIPMFIDQPKNTFNLMQDGGAEMIHWKHVTSDEIKRKILMVIENPKYKINMMRRSKRLRDQPQSPLERALWWINWSIRNGEVEYIQSPVKRLGHFKGNCLDILLVAITVIFLSLYTIFVILRCCCCSKKIVPRKEKKS